MVGGEATPSTRNFGWPPLERNRWFSTNNRS